MSAFGLHLAIKHLPHHDWWRVYEIQESERFGRYATVLRTDDGKIRNFHDETTAREFIESQPDATEVEYP